MASSSSFLSGFDPNGTYDALRRMGMTAGEAKDVVDMLMKYKGSQMMNPMYSQMATPYGISAFPGSISSFVSGSSSSLSPDPEDYTDFEVGDEVIANTRADKNYSTTVNGWTGVVTSLHSDGIMFDVVSGVGSSYTVLKSCFNLTEEMKKKKKIGSKKALVFDPSKLEALVIEEKVREEIVAVLEQHKNHDKLFDEWGLGEIIEYGRGMTFMFYGGPGTGKTWGATCIAKALGTELLTVSAAEIQSSEPGGANRAIQEAFRTAKKEGKVVFLDECDSLISARNDLGMVLASEVNTLLTEIEKFEGVAILATNRVEHMDEALERRISLIVEFPNPDFENRKKIWAKLLPKKMPLAKEVSVEALAKEELTGGQIKNVVLQAARMALAGSSAKVEQKHFDLAIARIKKSKNLMGSASRYRQGIIRDDFTVGKGSKIITDKTRVLKDFLKDEEEEDVISDNPIK